MDSRYQWNFHLFFGHIFNKILIYNNELYSQIKLKQWQNTNLEGCTHFVFSSNVSYWWELSFCNMFLELSKNELSKCKLDLYENIVSLLIKLSAWQTLLLILKNISNHFNFYPLKISQNIETVKPWWSLIILVVLFSLHQYLTDVRVD